MSSSQQVRYVKRARRGGAWKEIVVAAPFEPLQIGAIDLLSRDARVQGWSSGTAADSTDAMAFAVQHGVRPMIERFPLQDAPRALEAMTKGTVRFREVRVRKPQAPERPK